MSNLLWSDGAEKEKLTSGSTDLVRTRDKCHFPELGHKRPNHGIPFVTDVGEIEV